MLILAFLVFDGFLLSRFFESKSASPGGTYPEIADLQGKKLSFKELSKYFTALAEDKGAEYAYEVLKIAPIPPGTDMHLMGHVVGDILYKQKGAEGIKVCTQDFRNACSHSIVVGLLLERGEAALPEITEACRKAPGGSGAYTMCFHGLGHGILAYTGYDMEKAVVLCEKTGSDTYGRREYIECVGGTVMEIIGGGFHNRELWKEQSKKYLSKDEPLGLCAGDIIPLIAKPQCYTYLTPHLFLSASANLANPGPEHFEKAFPFCEKIPAEEQENRNACYSGFGKEFTVLAKARDIRNIDEMSGEELARVYQWCLLAENQKGILACLNSAAASLFWGGENNRGAVIRFCGAIKESDFQSSCFANLIGAVSYYIKDRGYKESFCGELPAPYQKECETRLLN